MDLPFDLAALQEQADADVKSELEKTPTVEDAGDNLNIDDLKIIARTWHRVTDVVAVVADLKNSTKLHTGKRADSTASIYQAATGNAVRILDRFDTDFLQIQGDGVLGIFWGDMRYERAVCAGITIKTFSRTLVERLEDKWQNVPADTGYKVGIASGRVLVKRVGTPRNVTQQEPIWAGKPVNYAAKAAQSADRHQLVVAGSVWDEILKNDYLAFSCPCNGGPGDSLWSDYYIEKLSSDEAEACGHMVENDWCVNHGASYCREVMSGNRRRDDTGHLRKSVVDSLFKGAMEAKAKQQRDRRRAHLSGLR